MRFRAQNFRWKETSPTNRCWCRNTFIWYQNICGMFFRFVTKHACDGRTDKISIPRTTLALLRRAVKTVLSRFLNIFSKTFIPSSWITKTTITNTWENVEKKNTKTSYPNLIKSVHIDVVDQTPQFLWNIERLNGLLGSIRQCGMLPQ